MDIFNDSFFQSIVHNLRDIQNSILVDSEDEDMEMVNDSLRIAMLLGYLEGVIDAASNNLVSIEEHVISLRLLAGKILGGAYDE